VKKIRAYDREARKRLIIHVLAEHIRVGRGNGMSASEIANAMDITASTKLRLILRELARDGLLAIEKVDDAGIAGFREIYSLNELLPAFSDPHPSRKAARRERLLTLHSVRGVETLVLS